MSYKIFELINRYKKQRQVIIDEIKTLNSDLNSLNECKAELDNLISILESEV